MEKNVTELQQCAANYLERVVRFDCPLHERLDLTQELLKAARTEEASVSDILDVIVLLNRPRELLMQDLQWSLLACAIERATTVEEMTRIIDVHTDAKLAFRAKFCNALATLPPEKFLAAAALLRENRLL